jgi:hypothetical protein
MREGGSFLGRDIGEPWDDWDRARHAELEQLILIDGLAWRRPPPRKPRKRKPTLAAALKEADRAGRPVRGAVIEAGKIELNSASRKGRKQQQQIRGSTISR